MITLTLLPFLLAVKVLPGQEDPFAWKPSAKDAQELTDNLKGFEKKVVNGRMQYPFELYLESKDIISFGDFGEMQVRNPQMYSRMQEIEGLRGWIADQELQKIFDQFPEERVAHQEKLKKLFASFKSVNKFVQV
jgi:hypothetical protein